MIGGLNAPAAFDNRAASAGNQPSVAVPRVQAPAADTTPWTVAVTDDQHEEMPIPRIVELFAAGTINVETYIWKQGMEDWQMPFDIPEIAAALRKRGLDPKANAAAAQKVSESARQAEKMPTAPPPAGMSPAGVWREPGSWNDGVAWKEPALAPGQEHHDVSFDDVTVALAAPQAEALLRDAELAAALDKDDKDDKDEPTAIFPGGPEAPPLSSPRPVVNVPRPAAGRPVPRHDTKPGADAEAIAGHPTPPAIAIETKAPTALMVSIDPSPASATPASRRATPVERGPDLFGEVHRAGSEESQHHDDGASAGGQKLIGERNESSVLFSLDKVVQTEQEHAQREKDLEQELLGLPTAPPPPEPPTETASLMSAAEEAAIDSALAAPDFSAKVVETTAPMPPVEPAPAPPAAVVSPPVSVAHAAPIAAEEPKQEGGSGWLWALLLLLLVGAAAAIVIFYLRPAALFGPPPASPETASSALPVPPPPPTNLEPVIPTTTPSAAAPSSAAPGASAPAPSAEAQPESRPKDRVEPRRPRDESSGPVRRERPRKPADEPSEESPAEETKPPVNLPPPGSEEGPRP